MLKFTTRVFPPEDAIWGHSPVAHRAMKEELIAAFRTRVLRPYDRGPQALSIRDAVHSPTRLHVEVNRFGVTAAFATWETGHVEMIFSTGCGLSFAGKAQAVTLLLSAIDEEDDRRALAMLRETSTTADASRSTIPENIVTEISAAERPLAATVVVSPDPLDSLLRTCADALAEAFFSQFGAGSDVC